MKLIKINANKEISISDELNEVLNSKWTINANKEIILTIKTMIKNLIRYIAGAYAFGFAVSKDKVVRYSKRINKQINLLQ